VYVAAAPRHHVAALSPGDAESPVAVGQLNGAHDGAEGVELPGVVPAENHVVQKVDLRLEGDVVAHLQSRLQTEAMLAEEEGSEAVVITLSALLDVGVALKV